MHNLGEELWRHHDAIVDRWYTAWRESPHPHLEVSEEALKDSLGNHLRLIGEQLRDLSHAEEPERLWQQAERLFPEKRVEQRIPIEEVVQEYALAVEIIRCWIEEQRIDVPFREYSYFYRAMFELVAESVRRYAARQAAVIRKERAQYLAGVMHQIRTPLAALSMQVDLLDGGEQQADSAAVSRLRRNVRRVGNLVDGILRLERFEAWEVPVRPKVVFPAHLIGEVMSDISAEASRNGLRFEAHVDPSLRIVVDPDLFVDALGNLVHNAIKYTTEGFVIVDAEERPRDVVFRVRDSGRGIGPDMLRTLFREPQPGSAGGAGIGLQIAQHAAQALGGTIEVKSAAGQGSVFSLHIPRVVDARNTDDDRSVR